jgi:hypothetical protein
MAVRLTRIAAALAALSAIAYPATWLLGRRWGATRSEASCELPGDALVPDVASQTTMAITIDAPPEDVWPWLVQMGVDRAGLYSLLWVENGLFRLGVSNADRIHPEWQDLKVGDLIAFMPEGYPGGRRGPVVTELAPDRAFVLCMGNDPTTCPGTWQFVLNGEWNGTTRLLLRSRSSANRSFLARLSDLILEPGYAVMSVAMLRGIRERAERSARDIAAHADLSSPLTQGAGGTPVPNRQEAA